MLSEAPSGLPLAAAAPGAGDEALQYTHSGRRYLLGYGRDFFGVWDRQHPGPPIARYPRTDEGWREAWVHFAKGEPYSTEVSIGSATAGTGFGAGPGGGPQASSPSQAGYGFPQLRRPVSPAWWLLPIFMGWLGGLIAWLVNRDADPGKARAMLIAGVVITALEVLLLFSSMSGP